MTLPSGLLGAPMAARATAPTAPTAPGTINSFADYQRLRRGGGEGPASAGAVGERDARLMASGGAPFTAKGLSQAFGNAMGIMGSGGITTGLKSMAELGLGKTPGTYGGFQNIQGHFSYDSDLVDAVKSARMSRAAANQEQERRNALRASSPSTAAMGGPMSRGGGARSAGPVSRGNAGAWGGSGEKI